MSFHRASLFGGAVLSATIATAGPSIVGTWQFRVKLTVSPFATAEQKKQIAYNQPRMAKMKAKFVFNPDHTFTVESTNGVKTQTNHGKWFQTGNTVTMSDSRGSQKVALAANGKTMAVETAEPGCAVIGLFQR